MLTQLEVIQVFTVVLQRNCTKARTKISMSVMYVIGDMIWISGRLLTIYSKNSWFRNGDITFTEKTLVMSCHVIVSVCLSLSLSREKRGFREKLSSQQTPVRREERIQLLPEQTECMAPIKRNKLKDSKQQNIQSKSKEDKKKQWKWRTKRKVKNCWIRIPKDLETLKELWRMDFLISEERSQRW